MSENLSDPNPQHSCFNTRLGLSYSHLNMPTNRPFFANFLAAFRAHSSPAYKATSSSTSPSTLASSAHVSTSSSIATSTTTASNARSIASKATTSPTSPPSNSQPASSPPANSSSTLSTAATVVAASSHMHHHHHHHVSPLSRSPGVTAPQHISMSPPGGASTPLSRGRDQRRGSDSSNSSGGFVDALGAEKWYIGGRTAAGEEKFYRLGLVTGGPGRRVRSLDRLSL